MSGDHIDQVDVDGAGPKKGCPFCESHEVSIRVNGVAAYWVGCDACGSTGPEENTREAAIESWDMRGWDDLDAPEEVSA